MDPPSLHDHIELPLPPSDEPTKDPRPGSSKSTTTPDSASTTDQNQNADSELPAAQSSSSEALAHQDPPQPITLDQELLDLKKTLGGVSASLGGWWGKVQKQSAEVLASSNLAAQLNDARKDLGALNLIEKAKREVERLGDHAKEGYSAISSELEKRPDPQSTEQRIVNVDGIGIPPPSRTISSSSVGTATPTPTAPETEDASSSKGKERASEEPLASPSNPLSVFDTAKIGSFFSKITKDSESLTASLQSKMPQLPSSGAFDLTEIQKMAEGYLSKGEGYLQDVGKELKEFVQDAVKVIPPSDDDDDVLDPADQSGTGLGLAEKRRMLDLKRETMISQLRRDRSQLLADPREGDAHVQNAFDEFLLALQQAGGLEGEAWKKRITSELQLDDPDLSSLQDLLQQLVPGSMTAETFWTRYFFWIHQIDQEEAARRVVLSAAQEDNEGEFSWDMEDESEPTSPAVMIKSGASGSSGGYEGRETPKQAGRAISREEGGVERAREAPLPASQPSRRTSASEPDTSDGFDVVSAQQSSDEKPLPSSPRHPPKAQDDDDDSDWE